MKKSLIAVLMVVGALLPASGGARTADFNCTGFSTGGTFANVVVPAGQSCVLDHARVTGNVTVKTAASLSVTTTSGDSTIAGKVTGNACDFIDLESTGASFRIVVGGDVNITNCTGSSFSGGRGSSGPGTPPQSLLIGGNTKCSGNQDECVFDYAIIAGNLDCSGNFGCTLQSDAIGNNVTANNNTGVGATIVNGAIAGNLACSGNVPGATNSGTPNTVSGTRSGQCSAPF